MSLEADGIAAETRADSPSPDDAARAPRRKPSPAYVGAWLVAGLAAAGYLAVAGTRPDLLADLSGVAGRAPMTVADHAPAAATGDEPVLRETVTRLQAEVSRLTANVIASEERASQLAEKVATLEAPGGATVATASDTKAPPAAATALAGKFVEPSGKGSSADARKPVQVAGAGTAAPAKLPTVLNAAPTAPAAAAGVAVAAAPATPPQATAAVRTAPAASPIETGSISPPPAAASAAPAAAAETAAATDEPISFGAAVVTPAPRPVGIQVATGASVDDLRMSWTTLTEQNDSLRSLQPRYTSKAAGAGNGFDLVAGPIKTAAQAKRICRALQARGLACEVTGFDGNAL